MLMHKVIKNSDDCLKTSISLWQYCSVKPAVNNANWDIIGFNVTNAITNSFKLKQKITGKTGTLAVNIVVPLKYLSNFLKILKMLLINLEFVYRCLK